jgi:DNA-binding winged helix-turn-helix (wHTH) protein
MNREVASKQERTGTRYGLDQGFSEGARCRCFGAFHLDLEQQTLCRDGMPVKVQGKVYQALVALVEGHGEIVTREALRAHLWPRDLHLNYDANVNTTVNKLRQMLGDTNEESKFIETIPRQGYRFVAQVNYADGLPEGAVSNCTGAETKTRETSGWDFLRRAQILRSGPARIWFVASMMALVMAAVLFGAAITLYSQRTPRHEMATHPSGQDGDQSSEP